MSKTLLITSYCLLLTILLTACYDAKNDTESKFVNHKLKKIGVEDKLGVDVKQKNSAKNEDGNKTGGHKNLPISATKRKSTFNKQQHFGIEDVQVVAEPDRIPVLVNKQNKLPDSYTPKDLIYTNIPFIVLEKSERTKMRREAANAIERLFSAANEQGIHLLGVSAYRSNLTQIALFNYYANKDGYKTARTYSAIPGTSEHETGLAIDITGGNGQCAAMDCFANTTEAKWLQVHASDFGFIIRYPEGKDSITGYKYEPWHLRYVGRQIAKKIMCRRITLEEYLGIVPDNH